MNCSKCSAGTRAAAKVWAKSSPKRSSGWVARIAAGPAEFQCVRGATRRAVLNRFPYAIYFRETDSEIMPRGQAARSSWPSTGGGIPRAGGREASPGSVRPRARTRTRSFPVRRRDSTCRGTVAHRGLRIAGERNDRGNEPRQILGDHLPDDVLINPKVVMDHLVTHADDVSPRNLGVLT